MTDLENDIQEMQAVLEILMEHYLKTIGDITEKDGLLTWKSHSYQTDKGAWLIKPINPNRWIFKGPHRYQALKTIIKGALK